MSLEEFEKLQHVEKSFDNIIAMLKRANQDGEAVMTRELEQFIEEIYY